MTDEQKPVTAVAELRWSDDGQPVSQVYDDVYFSRHDGLQETRYVFLNNNGLPERWRTMRQSHFVIAETGFGTGLNFLATWQSWLENAPLSASLHFISVEKYPLRPDDLRRALSLWPELQELIAQLTAVYPPVDARGFHRMDFGRVKLTLIFDDAEAGLGQLLPLDSANSSAVRSRANWSPYFVRGGLVDAWFLDGFAPAKNPQMWTDKLFHTMALLSHSNTTFATFTAAGIVRRGLQEAGFNWRKTAGYGRKREMLCGTFEPRGPASPTGITGRTTLSWHLTASKATEPCQSVAVIGAGLAGSTTANALAQTGIPVTVFERGSIACGASGNPQGIVYSRLSHRQDVLPHFNLISFAYALRFYRQTGLFSQAGNACGVLQLLGDDAVQRAGDIIRSYSHSKEFVTLLEAETASSTAGIRLQQAALYFPQSGWLAPKDVCRQQLSHESITLREQCEVTSLESSPHGWHLHSHDTAFGPFSAVVICSANQARQFAQCESLPTKGIRGQVSSARANNASRHLRSAICADGYIAPQVDGKHCLGATFDLTSQVPEIRWHDHAENLRAAAALANAFSELTVDSLESGRAGVRCTTPDYLPIVGPMVDTQLTKQRFAPLQTNAHRTIDADGAFLPNLYVNLGHGSRGLTYTPLCAQVIASLLTGTPMPLPRDLLKHLHPARFVIRDLIKNRRHK